MVVSSVACGRAVVSVVRHVSTLVCCGPLWVVVQSRRHLPERTAAFLAAGLAAGAAQYTMHGAAPPATDSGVRLTSAPPPPPPLSVHVATVRYGNFISLYGQAAHGCCVEIAPTCCRVQYLKRFHHLLPDVGVDPQARQCLVELSPRRCSDQVDLAGVPGRKRKRKSPGRTRNRNEMRGNATGVGGGGLNKTRTRMWGCRGKKGGGVFCDTLDPCKPTWKTGTEFREGKAT